MKRILCYGDSNTYGYDGRRMPVDWTSGRFDENTRWTCLLEKNLGEGYRICEEGLNGRTTVFDDPLEYGRSGIASIDIAFKTHQPVDLIMVMLGTNDLKDQFYVSADVIASGMERIIIRLKELISESLNTETKILVVAPANVSRTSQGDYMYGFSDRSVREGAALASCYERLAERFGCEFTDAGKWIAVDPSDGTHLSPESHRIFAENMAEIIKKIIG